MKVYFNNSCKICRSEINLYKKENIKDIDWIDITNNSDAEKETSKKDKEAYKEMREVWDHIEKADPDDLIDYLKTNKLPHVDEHLELARDYRKKGLKTIPDYFKRIARKFPDIQAWDIMDAQLKLDQKKKGEEQSGAGDEPLDNAVLKDDTLKDVK